MERNKPLLYDHFMSSGVEFPGRCISCGNIINSRIGKMLEYIDSFPFSKLIDVYQKYPEMHTHIERLKKIYCHITSIVESNGIYSQEKDNETQILFDLILQGLPDDFSIFLNSDEPIAISALLQENSFEVPFSSLLKFFEKNTFIYAHKLKTNLLQNIEKPFLTNQVQGVDTSFFSSGPIDNFLLFPLEEKILSWKKEADEILQNRAQEDDSIGSAATGAEQVKYIGGLKLKKSIKTIPSVFETIMKVSIPVTMTNPVTLSMFKNYVRRFTQPLSFSNQDILEIMSVIYPYEIRSFSSLPYNIIKKKIDEISNNILSNDSLFKKTIEERFKATFTYLDLNSYANSYQDFKSGMLLKDNMRILYGQKIESYTGIGPYEKIIFGLGPLTFNELRLISQQSKIDSSNLLAPRFIGVDLENILVSEQNKKMQEVNKELGVCSSIEIEGQLNYATYISKETYNRLLSPFSKPYSVDEIDVLLISLSEPESTVKISIYKVYKVLHNLGQFDYANLYIDGLIRKYSTYRVENARMIADFVKEKLPPSAFYKIQTDRSCTRGASCSQTIKKPWRMTEEEFAASVSEKTYGILTELLNLEKEILEFIAPIDKFRDVRWMPLEDKLKVLVVLAEKDPVTLPKKTCNDWVDSFNNILTQKEDGTKGKNYYVEFADKHEFALQLPKEMMEELQKKRYLPEELDRIPYEPSQSPFCFYPLNYYNIVTNEELNRIIYLSPNIFKVTTWSDEINKKFELLRVKFRDFNVSPLSDENRILLENCIYPASYAKEIIPMDSLISKAAELGLEEVEVLGPFLQIVISMVGLRLSCCRNTIINPYIVPDELYSSIFSNIQDIDPNSTDIIRVPNEKFLSNLESKAANIRKQAEGKVVTFGMTSSSIY